MHCLACTQPQRPKTVSEQHHAFLTSALYGVVLPALWSSRFTPKESTPELNEYTARQAPKSVRMTCRKIKSPVPQLLSHPACNPELHQLCYHSSLLLNSKKTNLLTCLIMWWCSMKETRQCHFKYFDKVTEFLSNSYQKIVINEILLRLSQCPLIPGNPTNEWFITIQNGCKSFTMPTAICQYTVHDTDHPQSHTAWFQAPIMK